MSIEITSRNKIKTQIEYHDVFVTWLPNESIDRVLKKVAELYEKGYHPIPHLAAFKIKDAEDARKIAEQIKPFTDTVFIIRGGGDKEGKFSTVKELVATEAFSDFKIGVGGFPDGNNPISYQKGLEILEEKKSYADFVVTQWSLNKKAIQKFLDDSPLPVYLGVPNRCTIKQLMRFAKVCGVENTIKGFKSNPVNLLRFMFGFSPNYIVNKFSSHKNLEKIHVYAFGNFSKL